jgi:hypothetical protein
MSGDDDWGAKSVTAPKSGFAERGIIDPKIGKLPKAFCITR